MLRHPETLVLLFPRRMGLLHPTGFLASPEKEGLFFDRPARTSLIAPIPHRSIHDQ